MKNKKNNVARPASHLNCSENSLTFTHTVTKSNTNPNHNS